MIHWKDLKAIFDIALREKDKNALQQQVTTEVKRQYAAFSPEKKANITEARYVVGMVTAVVNPEMLSIIRFDPADYLPRIHCPFLAIGGSRDIQVDADQNFPENFTVNTLHAYDSYANVSVSSFSSIDVAKLIPTQNAYADPVVQSQQIL